MPRIDISKLLFCSVIVIGLLGGAFMVGLYSGVRKNFAYEFVRDLRATVQGALTSTMQEAAVLSGTRPVWHLQPNRYEGDGVTINDTMDDNRILLSGFFENGNEVRLIRRDGSIVARWPVAFSEIFPDTGHIYEPPATDWNTDIHGALILPDGSVVFNFEFMGLVKLDRCGNLVWRLERPTHHSVEIAETGGFWVPSRRYVLEETMSKYPPFSAPYFEDTVMRVSEDGEVLMETSVVEMFYANHMDAILTATGGTISANWKWDKEIVHVNKIAELSSALAGDFPAFAAQDLLLSVRELNMVLVVDPQTNHIKWWSIGPWIRQHDPEFKRGGTIAVFNNNAYRTAFGVENPFDTSFPSFPQVSNILEVDPTTNTYQVIYGNKQGEDFLSIIRGKHQLTPRGGLLITEFEAGRVFETNSDGRIIWQFINKYSDEEVTEISEALLYTPEYFDVSDWSCAVAGT